MNAQGRISLIGIGQIREIAISNHKAGSFSDMSLEHKIF
jgi:hypothetical protein